jgi:hypothetical protein
MEMRECKRIESLRKFAGHERGGALSMDLDRAPRYWFSQVPHFRLGGPKTSGVMAEPVPDARSLKDPAYLPFEGIWRS